MKLQIFGIAIGLTGWIVIVHALGWMALVGIMLLMWGNNLERSSRET